MSTSNENVLEPHARYFSGTAMLFINTDASWSIGPNTKSLVKVTFGDFKAINDDTFLVSAISVESDGQGGYKLFVRSNADSNTIIQVAVDAAGNVDAASIAVLSKAQLYAAEDQYKVDLNGSGSYGGDSLLLDGGAVNLYFSADGAYQIGADTAQIKTLLVGGQPLTDKVLPPGWKIVEQSPSATGFDVYAQDPSGVIFAAKFDAAGEFAGGDVLSNLQLGELEAAKGVDIDGNNNVPAAAGWTSALKNAAVKTAVDAALASGNQITHAEAVSLVQGIVQAHKANANAAITADELADLQTLASRGATVFAGASASGSDYLSSVFGKMIDASPANRFYTGGQAKSTELGALAAGSTPDQLEKLLDKWLLGGDLPTPATAGDAATGKPEPKVAVYAKSSGTLFVDGVALSDVVQGTAGDCYMVAVAGGVAGSNGAAIQAMFVDNGVVNGTHTWGVRFFDAKGKSNWVTVNDMLPVDAEGSTTLAYGGAPGKNLSGEIWFALLEKAYAQVNSLGLLPRAESTGQNSYLAVEGGQGDPLAQFIAGTVTAYAVKAEASSFGDNPYITKSISVNKDDPAAVAALEKALKDAVNSGKHIWIGVDSTVKDTFGNQLLVGSHAHFALDADLNDPNNTSLLVYNPWGISALASPAGPLPSEFASPVPYSIAQLIGIAGLDFMFLEPLAGG